MSSSRRVSRKFALQCLFANEFLNLDQDNLISSLSKIIEGLSGDEFAKELISLVIINKKELDNQLQKKITHWKLSRINYVDLCLLRLGQSEINYGLEKKIVINEYVELAKEFGTQDSSAFINGVLDSKT